MQMEMLEMELIKKLQNTQAIQKQAYVELEEAINNRPTMQMTGNSQSQFRHQVGGSKQEQELDQPNNAGGSNDQKEL